MLSLTDDNSASTNFILSAAIWIMIGALLGLVLAIEFVFPDFARGISWLVFSRVRQAHVNTMLFAWLSGAMMGAWLYITPRLTGRKIFSELLGNLTVIAWNVTLVFGIVGLLLAHSQGREYAELVYAADVGVMLALIMNATNILMTIHRRVEPKLFVSLWFIAATVVLFPIVYFIGNVMWAPPAGALQGINDTIFNWFYGHQVLGLWITTGMLAIIYYIVPKETGTPLYSLWLGLISFWGTLFFYTGVGAHHLLWAPIPYWLKTVAVAESIGMVIPVVAFGLNILLTMRGNWTHLRSSVPLLFVITGSIAYILVSFQGSNQALRGVNEFTHFSQYVPGHAHLALLFFGASVGIGAAYYIMPRALRCSLYSRRLARAQYAFLAIGFAAFFIGFTLAGLTQSAAWVNLGLPVWTVLPGLRAFMAIRVMGAVLMVISFVMFAWNILATAIVRPVFLLPEMRLPETPPEMASGGAGVSHP